MVTVQHQRRRKNLLEMVSLAVPIGSAVFMSGVVITDWSRQMSAVITAVVVLGSIAGFCAYRAKRPANVTESPARDESADTPGQQEEEDDGRWDLFTLALLGVSIVVVVTVGLLLQFMIPLTIIFVFAGFGSASLAEVAIVVGATLATAFVFEFAVSIPLSKRWGLSID